MLRSLQPYFEFDYDGPAFALFGAGHLAALAVLATVVGCLAWCRQPADEAAKRRGRLLIASIMFLNEAAWHSWNIVNGTWNIQDHLPLHATSFSIWGSMYVLVTRSYRVYEIVFFIGIVGATQALITPSAGIYGLPHFRAFQTLIAHGMIVVAMTWMTAIEGFRPTWSSVWKSMVAINVLMLAVTVINVLIGSNYMYTLAKPATASLFDVMGPWPLYLAWAELLALCLFSLLYLPFALAARRER